MRFSFQEAYSTTMLPEHVSVIFKETLDKLEDLLLQYACIIQSCTFLYPIIEIKHKKYKLLSN